ncbi:unnamed protein product [Brassica napus]|uniref:(rape) hypothetical protein n=1 Tax=Brassica napus TaxID=3708 RepID=A0A816RDT9_BRANA|nr:unnamed protein product [Brassica napus]
MVPILNLPRTLFIYTSSSTRNSSAKKNSSTALLYNISLKMDLSSAPVAQTGRCHSTLDFLCKFYSNHTKFDHVQYSLGGSRMVRKTPPPGYICHRCNVSGMSYL